jgi:hypothetical protein
MANEFKVKNGLIIKRIIPDVTTDAASAFVFYKKNGTDPVLSINTSTGALTGIISTGAVESSLDLVASGAMFTALAGKQATITAGSLALSTIANIANNTILGNNNGSAAAPEALSASEVRTILNVADGATANAGTVTAVSSANTDIAVANGTTTPTLTLNAATTGADKILKLNGSGLIDASVLPAIAITDTYVVASEVLQLALTIQKGDVAVRTDQNKTYINSTGTNTAMSDWVELVAPGTGVTSVAAGNGMNFTTITASGSVTMGTPGAVTDASTDGVTTNSHTHSLASGAVTLAKMANLAANSIIGNNTGSAATPVALTTTQVRTLINVADGATANAGTVTSITPGTGFTNVTAITATGTLNVGAPMDITSSSTSAFGTGGDLGKHSHALADAAVALAKMANLAANSIIGNNTGSAAVPLALTASQVRTLINVADGATANTGTVTSITPGTGFTSVTPITATGTLDVGVPMDITSSSTSAFGTGGDLGKHSHSLANSAVGLGKIASIANNTILGNDSGDSAAPQALTSAEVIALLGIVAPSAISLATPADATTTVDSFADTTSSGSAGVRYDYFIKDSGATPANFRAGTVMVVYDGNSNVAEFYDTCTTDIGDTSGFAWTANITTNNVLLQAIVSATRGYNVRVVKVVI